MGLRKKLSPPMELKTTEEVNSALREIGVITMKIEAIDAKADQEIGKIKERAAKEGEEHRERITELDDAIALFLKVNKHNLFTQDKRSLPLSYGTVGFRKSTKVRTKKTTLELIKKLFADRKDTAIRNKEEPNKDILADWKDEELAAIDAAKVVEDNPYYEVNREEVNKNLMQKAV